MIVNKKIRSGNDKVDKYISDLENFLLGLENNNIYKLVKACDENAGVIADDVRLLSTENDDDKLEAELKMLGSRKNKRFEAFLSLMKQLKDFDIANAMLNKLKPTEAEIEADEDSSKVVPLKPKRNIQDFVIKT